MNIKLIGWPAASGRGTWETVAARGITPSGDALSTIIVIRHTEVTARDITGAGMGAGAGKLGAARAVGVGDDDEYKSAEAEAENCARSQWIADLLRGEAQLGNAMMLLAGGRGFLAGAGVRLNDNGMAARAARYIKSRRGVTPSDTSLEDAAAAATAALVPQVAVWEYVLDLADLPAARVREDACCRHHLAGVAWRAAFHSLTDDLDGDVISIHTHRKGAGAGVQLFNVPLALDAGQCAAAAAALQAHFTGGGGARAIGDTTENETRRALGSWVWRNLVTAQPGGGANGARTRADQRRRARFLIRLIHGATWADAARLVGYVDGGAASKALAQAQTWAALGAAQASDAGAHPIAVQLRRNWARAARAEVRARRAARVFLHTTAARGGRRLVARGIPLPGGGVR